MRAFKFLCVYDTTSVAKLTVPKQSFAHRVCVCVCVCERESHSCSVVCVCALACVCERGRQGHTTAACVQTHTSFISYFNTVAG